jgi:hypothetical protein
LIGGLGGSKSARTGTSSSTSTSTPGYTPLQSTAQGSIWSTLSNLLGGSASPEITSMQTQAANQINQNYSGLGDRMNRFLAARGFGKSGKVGQLQEQNELSRQGALAGNASNFANTALNEQNTALSDALSFAFTNPSNSSANASTYTNPGSGLANALYGVFTGLNSGANQLVAAGAGG